MSDFTVTIDGDRVELHRAGRKQGNPVYAYWLGDRANGETPAAMELDARGRIIDALRKAKGEGDNE